MYIVAVNRNKVKDIVSVHRDVRTINGTVLYLGFTVIKFNNFPSFRILI